MAQVWHANLVLNQLQYTGMLDTLTIRKQGYPARPEFGAFYERFKPLHPDTADHTELVAALRGRGPEYSANELIIGKTKVLMRDDTVRALEAARDHMMLASSLTLQSVYRGRIYAAEYKAIRQTYLTLLGPMRAMVTRTMVAYAEDRGLLGADLPRMEQYMEQVHEERQHEDEERRVCLLEDLHMQSIMDATMQERFAAQKDEETSAALHLYRRALEMKAELDSKLSAAASEAAQSPAEAPVYTLPKPYRSQVTRPYRAKFKIQSKPGSTVEGGIQPTKYLVRMG